MTGGPWLPAEDAAHRRTWMCWPSTEAIYGRTQAYFEAVQENLGRLAGTIAEREPVTLLAAKDQHELAARLCGPKVELLDAATDDMWARDTGPVFIKTAEGTSAAIDFNFNGWGGKERHSLDKGVAKAICGHLGFTPESTRLVGEGGGLEYDGDGTLLLAESCWVNDNRNPGMTRDDIEAELKRLLGVEVVIWVPGVRDQDDTDGHIDGSFRFVRPGLVIASQISDRQTDWAEAEVTAKAILARAKDARGRSFEVVDIPEAENFRSSDPNFFPGYANYYVGNGALYTPQFGDATTDAFAQETFAKLFADREIVALNVDRIYENGGGMHCVTQQEPA
ncbi:MAG: agmatine deiminase family protein [Pseudomonadota bacterium]